MGDVKDNMAPKNTTDLRDKAQKKGEPLLGFFKSKKKKEVKPEEVADNFADMVTRADEKLYQLIVQKQADVKSEGGKEVENNKKLAMLETMQFHLDKIIDLGSEYGQP